MDRTDQLYLVQETVSAIDLPSLNPLIIFFQQYMIRFKFFIIQSFLVNLSKLIFFNYTKIKLLVFIKKCILIQFEPMFYDNEKIHLIFYI